MINSSFEQISNLQYCLKNARRQIQAFQSGEKYVQMEQAHKMMMRAYERQIRELQRELAAAHRETIICKDPGIAHYAYRLYERPREWKICAGLCMCDTQR